FLPIDPAAPIEISEDEDLTLREEVDDSLQEILDNVSEPPVVEARGTVAQKLAILERATANV
ncbi:MAG TPA: hypothetical protein VFT12_00515, partial [Thermoanaerobaculia bacterium]|nr:hypothetical protein [Thermoanaerobaculia bacterium]